MLAQHFKCTETIDSYPFIRWCSYYVNCLNNNFKMFFKNTLTKTQNISSPRRGSLTSFSSNASTNLFWLPPYLFFFLLNFGLMKSYRMYSFASGFFYITSVRVILIITWIVCSFFFFFLKTLNSIIFIFLLTDIWFVSTFLEFLIGTIGKKLWVHQRTIN